jgi:peptide/nickel transport system permease protein
MTRFILKRLALFPVVVILANFLGFAYAFYIGPLTALDNPYSSSSGGVEAVKLIPAYTVYVQSIFSGNLGEMPNNELISTVVTKSALNSLVLLVLALVFSILFGLLGGLAAVRPRPPRVASWLTIFSTVGLAAPSFYIGILLISFSVMYVIWGPTSSPLVPFQGFGWDAHLILPVLALMVQPAVKTAQVTANLLVEEMGKQYVVAALSMGHTLTAIRRHFALRNVMAPVVLVIAGSLRFMVAELIIIERLFDWPGFGRLFSTTIVLTSHSENYLLIPLMAAMMTMLAVLYYLTDTVASILARIYDPRLERT